MIGRIKATTALWWFCCIVVAAMFVEAIVRIFVIGITIASGWWLLRKAASWCFGRKTQPDNLVAEKAFEVVPTSVVFSKAR